MGRTVAQICSIELECTEASEPFEKRSLTFKPDTVHVIGRIGKNPPTLPAEKLLFDSRVLSRKHAKLFLQGGKLYLLDLNSNHGTYVNGKKIPTEGKDPNSQVWNAHEVKTGDIVRFGSSRKTCSSGEVIEPIEGRLVVTFAPMEKPKSTGTRAKDPAKKTVHPEAPSDGPEMVKMDRQLGQQSTSPKAPPVRSDVRKWSMLQPAETGQRGTLTDPIDTATNSSQTMSSEEPAANEAPTSHYERWLEAKREFSAYRRQTLCMIVVCLLAATFYHLVANSLEATVGSNNRRRFPI